MSNKPPFLYTEMNQAASQVTPSTIHVVGSQVYRYFQRALFERVLSRFTIKGCPDEWDISYLKTVQFALGFLSYLKTDRYGVIPQQCGLGGYNIFYRPSYAIIANPLFDKTYQLTIGKQCEVVVMSHDYKGILDIVNYYASQMALAVSTAEINLANSKLSFVFGAKNKTMADSFKKLYDSVASGEPAVVLDTKMFNERGDLNMAYFAQDVGTNFIADRIYDVIQTMTARFDTEVGIANTNSQKKERMIVDEVNANNVETMCRANLWLENLNRGQEKVNRMFGLNTKWEFTDFSKNLPKNEKGEGGVEDERKNIDPGTV